MVYQHASSNTNFNMIVLITGDEKRDALLDEINHDDSVLLQRSFVEHCRRLHFNGDSGLIPYRILATHVYIQRMSPTLYNTVGETFDDDNDEL